MFNPTTLIKLLKENPVTILFKKKNGDERWLFATLDMNLIPEDDHPMKDMGDSADHVDDTHQIAVISVYDLDIYEWRSFKVENLIAFSVLVKEQ